MKEQIDNPYERMDQEGHDEFIRLALHELPLTEQEASAIADACNGCLLMPGAGWQVLWAEVYDADRLDGLGAKWGVDANALARRIKDSSLGARYALAVAIARFWRSPKLNELSALELFNEVGIRIRKEKGQCQ